MIRTEANHLADRVTRMWPRGGITVEIWAEVLEEMYYAPAEAALRKLRDSVDVMPSIAQYKSAYNAQLGTAREDRVSCSNCGGDGWQTVKQYEVNGRMYDGVKPCTCRNRNATRDVHRRILDLNTAELAPHSRHSDDHAVGPPTFNPKGW